MGNKEGRVTGAYGKGQEKGAKEDVGGGGKGDRWGEKERQKKERVMFEKESCSIQYFFKQLFFSSLIF